MFKKGMAIMAEYTYEAVNPSLVENTIMRILLIDGVRRTYNITANEGHVLHDNTLDAPVFDEETGAETGEVILGYTEGTTSCHISYDWNTNKREFYAVPSSEIPEGK